MSVEELKELLDQYDEMYYDLDEPLISDEEYDVLKDKYLKLVVSGETEVGGHVSSKFKKVKHIYSILSLEKVKDEGTLAAKMSAYGLGVVQPKLDGLTVVVYGKNVLSDEPVYSTRGTGSEGEDITATANMIPGLKPIDDLTYRAEIIMLKEDFERINKERIANGEEPFANPRNAAAGIIRQTDPSKVQGLTYFAYNILDSKLTEEEQIDLLKMFGIKTVPSKYFDDNDESRGHALNWILNFDKAKQQKLPYEIDGMVIKSNIPDSLNKYGTTGHHPKNAIAYKYPVDAVKTTLLDVVWQLGKSGAVSPVGIFKGVDILGSTVSRATLHNMDYINALDLHIGATISVIKANMIIPKIISCEPGIGERILPPLMCPVCRSKLEKDGATLICRNADCKGLIITQVVHMAKKECLNIEGLSTQTVTKMFDMGYLNDKLDIFNVTEKQILALDGFAGPSASKLYNAIQNSRNNVPFDKFLYANGIYLLGRTASKAISKYFTQLSTANNLDDPCKLLIGDVSLNDSSKLISINGIGREIVRTILYNLESIKKFSDKVTIAYESVLPVKVPTKQLTFVITGSLFRGTRDEYKSKIELMGHKLSGSVSKKTDYLVTNDTTLTTKLQKAKELGVPIIDELELIALLSM